jgi:phosphate transport system substrate-binding protein
MKCVAFLLILVLQSCSGKDKTIKIKGSDTEVNLSVQLAESFHEFNKAVFVSVSGGGSGMGIASLLNGTADIANSSRRINEKELELFRQEKVELDSFIFAQDAIAFVVSKNLPIDSIHLEVLSKILSGETQNWSALTRIDKPINIYGRQSNSGTHDFIKNKLGIDFSQHAKQMSGNAQILEAIRADNSGIGYVGAGYLIHGGDKGLKILSIYDSYNLAISPLDSIKISEGKYFFQRPLFQYFRKKSFSLVKPFIDFEKIKAGQKIIRVAGYYPI